MADNFPTAASDNVPALPDKISGAIQGMVSPFVPTTIKVVVRLINSAVEYPVALVEREIARVRAQTRSIEAVEAAVGQTVATRVVADEATLDRAATSLLHRSYREQVNKEGVSIAFVEEMIKASNDEEPATASIPDEDWMGPYEQYAGMASSDRVRRLWGKVLAGEVLQKGSFSINSLRVLSETSQKTAESFSNISRFVVGDVLPCSAVNRQDITDIVNLEDAGILMGSSSAFNKSYFPNPAGMAGVADKDYALIVKRATGVVYVEAYKLTNAGKELLALIENRDQVQALKELAALFRGAMPFSHGSIIKNRGGEVVEELWNDLPLGGEEAI